MRLLLHICCGPCSVFCIDDIRSAISDADTVTGLFYNPNIHPMEEFEHRRDTCIQSCNMKGLELFSFNDFQQEKWENFDNCVLERCNMCYNIRMGFAARYAAENGFTHFTTTLLISPYQRHDMIKEVCVRYAEQYGIEFYYRDFRPGFREGQRQAREMGLYRQKYCGCIRSLTENAKENANGKHR